MSQVDIVSYFPSLFWLFLNLILLYIIIGVNVVPSIYTVLKIRNLFLLKLEKMLISSENFFENIYVFLYFFFKKYKNIQNFILNIIFIFIK